MSELNARDRQDIGQYLGRTWGWVLTAGLLTVLLGIVVLAWPDETILVVSWFIGIYLIVTGVAYLVQSFTGDRTGGMRVMLAIGGILSLILGVFAFQSFTHSVALLAVIIGVAWLINGITMVMAAIGDHEFPGRGWAIFGGIMLMIGGLVILLWPAISLYVLVTFFGIWLLIVGVFEIFAAFRMRSTGKTLATA